MIPVSNNTNRRYNTHAYSRTTSAIESIIASMEVESSTVAIVGAGGVATDTGAEVVLLLTVTVSTVPVDRARTIIGPIGSPKRSSERGDALVKVEFLRVV